MRGKIHRWTRHDDHPVEGVPLKRCALSMRRDLAVALFLVVSTLTVYGQVFRHDFVTFDDGLYVYENPHVQKGLTWDEFRWAFTTLWATNWHPLTWLSHMLDCELFGLNAGNHHLVNVFLHIVNSLLLFMVLRGMTGAVWRSATVASLFALHPLHVESVAWVAERKDVLSTLFFMLTLWAYGRYANRPCWTKYGTVFVFLALGLMAKPMLVTVPFLMVLLDYWPLRRFRCAQRGRLRIRTEAERGGGDERRAKALHLFMEKVPFFVLVIASCAVTFVAQQHGGATTLTEVVPFGFRVVNALVSYVAYLAKMVWPESLAVFYPYRVIISPFHWLAAGLALLGISSWVVWARARRPYLAVGWFWYLGTLVPVIGLVQVGRQSMADRYTYVPLIGIFLMLVWYSSDLTARWRRGRSFLAGFACLTIAACMVCTWIQVSHWRDGVSLFEHSLKVTGDNALAHNNLGYALEDRGDLDGAILHYRAALRLNPQYCLAHSNLGNALVNIGKLDQAIRHYREALRLNPEFVLAQNSLGVALAKKGSLEEAIAHYQEAIRLDPKYALAHSNLGVAFMEQGRLDEALERCRQAAKLRPKHAEIQNNLGVVLDRQGKLDEALEHYREAVLLNPEYAKAHNNLGLLLARRGKMDQAIVHYREAVRIRPKEGEFHKDLGTALMKQGKMDESLEHLLEAVRLDPEDVEAYNNLGILYAQNGKLNEAIASFRRALNVNSDSPEAHRGLAMALADRGGYEEAVEHYHEAIRLKPDDPGPYNNLAWLLATNPDPRFRDGAEAIALAERACDLSGTKDPNLLDTLAAAYAEAGRFKKAIGMLQEAISLDASGGNSERAEEMGRRLNGYRAGKPYREAAEEGPHDR